QRLVLDQPERLTHLLRRLRAEHDLLLFGDQREVPLAGRRVADASRGEQSREQQHTPSVVLPPHSTPPRGAQPCASPRGCERATDPIWRGSARRLRGLSERSDLHLANESRGRLPLVSGVSERSDTWKRMAVGFACANALNGKGPPAWRAALR